MPDETIQNEPMVTKMSVKGLGCKPTGGLPSDDSKPNPLCIIAGKVNGVKMGEDGNGKVWSALVGSFRGTVLATGVSVRSGKLFLPSGIHEIVEKAALDMGEGGNLKFAFQISSVKASNPIGYSYQATSLLPMEAQTDELADLIAITDGAQKQLTAPAAAPEAPAKPAEAAAPAKKK